MKQLLHRFAVWLAYQTCQKDYYIKGKLVTQEQFMAYQVLQHSRFPGAGKNKDE